MRDNQSLLGKKIAILGWGVDTLDVIPYFQKLQCKITVFDAKNELDIKSVHGVDFKLGSNDFGDLSTFDLIVRNPAIYRFRKEIVDAEKRGVEISSKMKLFFDLCPAKIIGVTGTKGKGTTSTLIYEILKAGGKKVFLGGNIGLGVFEFLEQLTSDSWVVLELSSFQLIDLSVSPHIAVVLMVTSDHLDWHSSVTEYINAKKNIVSHQTKEDFSVVNQDYSNSVEIGNSSTGQVVWVSKDALENVLDDEIGLIGKHNRENVVAASTVAKLIGIPEEVTRDVIKNFKGLEHRLEFVAMARGVKYYNDSFSTTPETTIAAINSFSEPIILIAGGSEKGSDFSQLGITIAQKKNIKAVILIGLMAERIKEAILQNDPSMNTKIVQGLKTMEEIVQKSANLASDGDVVLLSPGAASFDMFTNYKDRGLQFKSCVLSLS